MHLPRHGDDALAARTRTPLRAARRDARRRTSSRAAEAWEEAGLLALVGIGVEPGLSDVFAALRRRRAVLARSTSSACATAPNLVVEGYDFAPTFSIWTTIEECLNPPVIWERERGWYTTAPFSRARGLRLPRGHRPGRVRQRRARGGRCSSRAGSTAKRVTFKYGLGEEFIDVLQDAAQARASTRPTPVQRARRRGRARATSSPPRCPTRRRSATG